MKLYLVQHGEAKSKAEDPRRPLTERGKEEVARVAAFAAGASLQAKGYMDRGQLVPHDVTIAMVEKRRYSWKKTSGK